MGPSYKGMGPSYKGMGPSYKGMGPSCKRMGPSYKGMGPSCKRMVRSDVGPPGAHHPWALRAFAGTIVAFRSTSRPMTDRHDTAARPPTPRGAA